MFSEAHKSPRHWRNSGGGDEASPSNADCCLPMKQGKARSTKQLAAVAGCRWYFYLAKVRKQDLNKM